MVGTGVFGGGGIGGVSPLPLNHQIMWEGWGYNSFGAQIVVFVVITVFWSVDKCQYVDVLI